MNEEKMNELLGLMRAAVPDVSDMTDAGKIGFAYKSEYDPSASYERLDVVKFGTSLWTPKQSTSGNPPPDQLIDDVTENEYWELYLPGGNGSTGDISNATVRFEEAEERENIETGEKQTTLFGKIAKWFSSLKKVAFSGSYDDLSDKPDLGAYYMLSGGTPIASNSDLNDDKFRVPGNYYCAGIATGNTLVNCPIKSAFTMKVELSNGGSCPCQTIREFSTGGMYFRTFNMEINTWKAWEKICGPNEFLKLTGGTVTGNTRFAKGNYVGKVEHNAEDGYYHLVEITNTATDSIRDPILINIVERVTNNNGASIKIQFSFNGTFAKENNTFSCSNSDIASRLYLVSDNIRHIYDLYIKKKSAYASITIASITNSVPDVTTNTPLAYVSTIPDTAVQPITIESYSLAYGIRIVEGSDLDDIKLPGNYYCDSIAASATLVNCPTRKAFTMKVEMSAGIAYPCQTIREYSSGEEHFRCFETSNGKWGIWRLMNGSNILRTYYDESGFDFNDYGVLPGVHRLSSSLANAPASVGYGNVLVVKHGSADTMAMLVFPYGRTEAYIRCGNKTGFATNKWDRIITENMESHYKLESGIAIASEANLNTILTVGNYYCETNAVAVSLTNCPTNEAFTMKVELSTGVGYPCQTLRSFSSGVIYYRHSKTRSGASDQWSDWKTITPGGG